MLVDHHHNLNKCNDQYTDELRSVISLENTRQAFNEISSWEGYEPTLLLSLEKIALKTGVK